MNAVMTQAIASDPIQRYDASRRRNAESAYNRNVQYNGQNQKTVENLEALLIGKKEPEIDQSKRPEPRQLGAGQMKQIALPIGTTLEETIASWKDVRAEAISEPEPTTADYNLAATASAKIMRTEAQIILHNRAQSEIDITSAREEADTAKMASKELPSDLEREILITQRRYEKAISSYSFQVLMKQKGFEIDRPSFYKIA
ncbi:MULTISPECIES: hypothetical protein [Sporosarcina]|uniref:hypothetical protein n=1 Tax=Sporosarcina TaxID=1569 RepID=UPI00078E362C|nr:MULTISPECIES: hypothetical protein [Sporosarcina]AMQ08009.1 hypothetical protein AZE41_19845 [Sporosarcina psychrophila]QNK87717.1 hypothetical protein H7992_21520 [Sporosarcina sp. resist]